jgi:hypothetical protein
MLEERDDGLATAKWREPTRSDRLPVYRSESPTGYSSAGCSPAEPASASPVTDIVVQSRPGAAIQCAAQLPAEMQSKSRSSCPSERRVSSLLCTPGDISMLRRQRHRDVLYAAVANFKPPPEPQPQRPGRAESPLGSAPDTCPLPDFPRLSYRADSLARYDQQLEAGAGEACRGAVGRSSKAPAAEDAQKVIDDLHRKIGQLQVECDFLAGQPAISRVLRGGR